MSERVAATPRKRSQRPRLLVAPDKFKGTYSAGEVAAALAEGVRRAGGEPLQLPIADGGEGTADALLAARGGRWVEGAATDALGRPLAARFALLDEDEATAVVEVAEASGLARLRAGELDALRASTRGTGELIAAAAEAGASTVIVSAGGSATTDGGIGALAVLRGRALPRLIVACDTRVAFERAAAVYGPQKGADAAAVAELDARLDAIAEAAPRDPRGRPLTGAAGGLAGGLWAWLGAELMEGAQLVFDELGVDARLEQVEAVLTGEGRLDEQTATGKAVGALAARCGAAGVPCHAIVGTDALPRGRRARLGLASVTEATTAERIARAAATLVRQVA